MDKHEEHDEFYDSLDDLPSSPSASLGTPRENSGSTSCLFVSTEASATNSCISGSRTEEDDDVTSLIPLYGGEVQKSARRKRVKRKPKSLELLEGGRNAKANSYVALFHARIGNPSERCRNKTVPESARALDGDLTRRTVEEEEVTAPVEVFEDAQAEHSDDTERQVGHSNRIQGSTVGHRREHNIIPANTLD